MDENELILGLRAVQEGATLSNVKEPKKTNRYERFGETIRYMTVEELQQFLNVIEDYRHKLMMQVIYELGCRVGEFVRIQLKHLNFSRCAVYFPAENTKTKQRRVSHLPPGLMNEIKSLLRQKGRMAHRTERLYDPEEYLFHPGRSAKRRYTENRLRQIFQGYVRTAGLDREYGRDKKGRVLHELTIHSTRHSHIMHYVHVYKLPLPIVQKQVGHKSLKTTSVYLRPSDEHVGEAYAEARSRHAPLARPPKDLNTPDVLSFYNDTTKGKPTRT
jgi:integrase/recombinase XerD